MSDTDFERVVVISSSDLYMDEGEYVPMDLDGLDGSVETAKAVLPYGDLCLSGDVLMAVYVLDEVLASQLEAEVTRELEREGVD